MPRREEPWRRVKERHRSWNLQSLRNIACCFSQNFPISWLRGSKRSEHKRMEFRMWIHILHIVSSNKNEEVLVLFLPSVVSFRFCNSFTSTRLPRGLLHYGSPFIFSLQVIYYRYSEKCHLHATSTRHLPTTNPILFKPDYKRCRRLRGVRSRGI